jgi:hypothetical protein
MMRRAAALLLALGLPCAAFAQANVAITARVGVPGTGVPIIGSIIACNQTAPFNTSSAGEAQIVAAIAGKTIYVCSYTFVGGGTTSASLTTGTGTNCAGSTASLTPPYPFAAQTILVDGADFWRGIATPPGNALCVNNGSAAQITGIIYYTQF